jgi:hypothetical protein
MKVMLMKPYWLTKMEIIEKIAVPTVEQTLLSVNNYR